MSADKETVQPMKAPGDQALRPGSSASPSATAAAAADEKTELKEKDVVETDTRPFFFRHITAIVKFCAALLVVGMWVCTVFLIEKRHEKEADFSPWYCLAVSTVITLLEMVWFFNVCACCRDDGGCCCTCWRVLMWLDNWKKGLLYIIIAIPAFINRTVLSIVCGVLIVVLGLLYIIKTCAGCQCVGGKRYVPRPKDDQNKKKHQQPDEESPALPPSGAGDAR